MQVQQVATEFSQINNVNSNSNEREKTGTIHMNLLFPFASQADIIRSYQKDNYYINHLYKLFDDLIKSFVSQQYANKKQKQVKLFSNLLYFVLNTLRGIQTLGEEYCDIIQIQTTSRLPLSIAKRFLLLIIQVLSPYFFLRLLNKLSRPRYMLAPEKQSNIFVRILQSLVPMAKPTKEYFEKLHLGIFYLFGNYYEFSKRIVGIQYLLNRKINLERPRYQILGILIFIQLIFSTFSFLKQITKSRNSSNSLLPPDDNELYNNIIITNHYLDENSRPKKEEHLCTLCLEERTYTTATPCGHLFCWTCIHDAIRSSKQECPLCRSDITPQSLIRLYCYE